MKIDLNEIKTGENLELLARQLVEGFITGLHKSPYHGFSVEFAEHRLYNEGESTRYIDWKVFARTDKLFIKRYEEETNLRCMIALDQSPSMYYPTNTLGKIKFSILAAASLSYLMQRQRDAVGLCLFSDTIKNLTQVKSTPTHINKLFSQLEHCARFEKPTQATDTRVAQVLHEIAEKIHKRSLVILFSDMFDASDPDELFKALQHLKHNKHEVIVFHVMDAATERSFLFDDKPIEFVDMETQERIKLNPGNIKTSYQTSLTQFYDAIRMRCNQYKIDYIEADIREGFHHVLQTYLIKRAKMR